MCVHVRYMSDNMVCACIPYLPLQVFDEETNTYLASHFPGSQKVEPLVVQLLQFWSHAEADNVTHECNFVFTQQLNSNNK